MNKYSESWVAERNRETYGMPESHMGKSVNLKGSILQTVLGYQELLKAQAELNLDRLNALVSGEDTLGFKFLGNILDEEIQRAEDQVRNAPYQEIVSDIHRQDQMARLALHQQIVGF